ncbi:hypothetical protein J2X69_002954 [Algoriphagus sp. 4150]|uniref:DUF2306 domain-containing protein n=1 Tax=Algoriphagus sp. 4150 TaxID=2817756 RepID=UPI00286233F4|nr:DUF2306 domain-containing protein [Algoriphagus sp. 4150]MDR7130598.1 hypothetical protein [Algoriphagus sp. 4150]
MSSTKALSQSLPNQVFQFSIRTWFIVVFMGQLIFAYYIIRLYGESGLQLNFERWNAQTTHGYIAKDLMGNVFFGVHVFFAAVITLLGPLQLIARIRKLFPLFHRFSGRIYLGSAFLISLAGFYLAWVRGAAGGLIGSVFISINGLIILICVFFTLRFALQRQLDKHYRWAIRLFLAMSGVWFFRVFLMLWLVIHQAPVGFDVETFEGPFLNFLYVFVYILPQVLAEIYFITKASTIPSLKFVTSLFLGVLTLGIVVGIAAATMGMWLPVI